MIYRPLNSVNCICKLINLISYDMHNVIICICNIDHYIQNWWNIVLFETNKHKWTRTHSHTYKCVCMCVCVSLCYYVCKYVYMYIQFFYVCIYNKPSTRRKKIGHQRLQHQCVKSGYIHDAFSIFNDGSDSYKWQYFIQNGLRERPVKGYSITGQICM